MTKQKEIDNLKQLAALGLRCIASKIKQDHGMMSCNDDMYLKIAESLNLTTDNINGFDVANLFNIRS